MRIILLITGSILLLIGLISMVTPMPGGTVIITIGGGMIICSSNRAARYVRDCRLKFKRINQSISWLEDKMGERLSGPLRRTRPDGPTVVEKVID